MSLGIVVTAEGPIACAAFAYRRGGVVRAVVVVKATFELVAGADALVARPTDLVLVARATDDEVSARASDLAPLKPQADVTFVGCAYAARGVAVNAGSARLAVGRDHAALDKTLHVFGDRGPFVRMPLRAGQPNVVDARDPTRAAGFAPTVAQAAPAVDELFDVADDVDWASFQAAPVDQRLPHLHGDERIVLDGLVRDHARLESRLPDARAIAIVTARGRSFEVPLALDTLAIDGEARTACVVWRGAFPFEGSAAVACSLTCGGGVVGARKPPSRLGSTVGLSDAEQVGVAGARPTPFAQQPAPPRPTGPRASCPPRTTPAIPLLTPRTPLVARAHGLAPTRLALATLPWKTNPPRHSVTVIAKAIFDLVEGGTARDREDEPVLLGDGTSRASDFVVWKRRADVTLIGTACGGERGVAQATFAFGDRDKGGFERRIAVFGDRRWQQRLLGAEPSARAPFTRIPLTWERAFGGEGFDDNPVGVGHAARRGADLRLPNLEAPDALLTSPKDAPTPACFAPIPMAWRPRARLAGTYDAAWLAERWPYFPADFDDGALQAAPAEQQVAHLSGGEAFSLGGMRPGTSTPLRGALPGLRVRCVSESSSGAVGEIAMHLDTAHFDADVGTVELVWRGQLDVDDDEARALAALFLAVEPIEAPVDAETVRAACLAELELPKVDAPRAPIANDPPADPELERVLAEARARVDAAKEKLAAAGLDTAAFDAEPAPKVAGKVPRQDAAAAAERLRAAGASPKQIADVEQAIAAANASLDELERPPAVREDVRARVVKMLEGGASFAGADLERGDLGGLDFSGKDLRGANLQGANLAACRFDGADLSGARASGAVLDEASLSNANLERADLHGAKLVAARLDGARLGASSFAEATATRASFVAATGEGVSFADGGFDGARFEGATLPKADFSRARLAGARFAEATLTKAQLFEAKGRGARFDRATLDDVRADEASFPDASFAGASAIGSTWEAADLDCASFRGAKLQRVGLVRANCTAADFSGAEMADARLSRATLARASFTKANLLRARLDHADLTAAELVAANLYGSDAWESERAGARLDEAVTARSTFSRREADRR